MSTNQPLLCRLIGHKWQEKSERTMRRACADGEFRKFVLTVREEKKACARCGLENPNHEETSNETKTEAINSAINQACGF